MQVLHVLLCSYAIACRSMLSVCDVALYADTGYRLLTLYADTVC